MIGQSHCSKSTKATCKSFPSVGSEFYFAKVLMRTRDEPLTFLEDSISILLTSVTIERSFDSKTQVCDASFDDLIEVNA